jgi:hypothetical protein
VTARVPAGTLRASWAFVGVCAVLVIVLHEAHELAHTATGRLLCGGWGPRDFNTWALPTGCESLVPTLAGPVFSFGVIWIGYLLLGAAVAGQAQPGLALVMSANPFGRLLTAAMGGGDEGVLVRGWLDLSRGPAATSIAFGGVALLCAAPLWRAWQSLEPRHRAPAFLILFLLPVVITGTLLFLVGNRLLARGVLAHPVVAGAPMLIWLVTLAAVTATVLLRRRLSAP